MQKPCENFRHELSAGNLFKSCDWRFRFSHFYYQNGRFFKKLFHLQVKNGDWQLAINVFFFFAISHMVQKGTSSFFFLNQVKASLFLEKCALVAGHNYVPFCVSRQRFFVHRKSVPQMKWWGDFGGDKKNTLVWQRMSEFFCLILNFQQQNHKVSCVLAYDSNIHGNFSLCLFSNLHQKKGAFLSYLVNFEKIIVILEILTVFLLDENLVKTLKNNPTQSWWQIFDGKAVDKKWVSFNIPPKKASLISIWNSARNCPTFFFWRTCDS